MLADNRLNELSSWDDQILGEILLDLSMQNLDFSLELTGFDMGEIDFRIEGLDAAGSRPRRTGPTPCRSPRSGPPVSMLGDLWLLGRHRLLCGNALEADELRNA